MIGYLLKMEYWPHLIKDFLKKKLKPCFIRGKEWPPSSPDINSLDYFYWDFVKTEVYEKRLGKSFASEEELRKIYLIYLCEWPNTDKKSNQIIVPRMKAVEEKQESCIKMLFG